LDLPEDEDDASPPRPQVMAKPLFRVEEAPSSSDSDSDAPPRKAPSPPAPALPAASQRRFFDSDSDSEEGVPLDKAKAPAPAPQPRRNPVASKMFTAHTSVGPKPATQTAPLFDSDSGEDAALPQPHRRTAANPAPQAPSTRIPTATPAPAPTATPTAALKPPPMPVPTSTPTPMLAPETDPVSPEPPVATTTTTTLGNSGVQLFYSYEELRTSQGLPPGVDPVRRESYLTDTEFLARFGMTKVEFGRLPKWRQANKKKELALF